ncbi:homeobox protein goosecoid-2-like [Cyprinus carpio]|uniref:Homeobox protein goosecoid-2-like n=1 Tax=Cyprinus carpio TaxID=7962 RepID=A0A9Q9Y549_CYPCA|nr:homeobox protein goosecoid-2-like [Cyprinus carpio]
MDKKSSAFTIDRILSTDDNKILGLEKPSAPGPCEEKSAPESMNQTDLRSTCCFCSHCGEILHTAASKRAFTPSGKQMFAEPYSAAEAHGRESFSHVQRRVRRHRTIFTEEQLDALEDLFRKNQYPDIHTREQLAQRTHLREERVEMVFREPKGQNARDRSGFPFIRYEGTRDDWKTGPS